ncbi:MAG: HAD family hydrolase [Clostridia bacterium]|nr:HAD family hydrolase [Clostridia bacterium]
MKYTYCIWDFNGTIFDDVGASISAVNTLLAERGLKTLDSKDKYQEVFDFPIIDYYRRIGFDFDKEPYEVIAPLWVDLYLENSKKSGLFGDVISSLDFFEARGIKQSVLSASEKNMLTGQLRELGIYDRFEEIMGIDNIYAESKIALAKDWKQRHEGERTLFIGDTTHDYETAEVLGADCYLISAGHQPEYKLRAAGENVKIFPSLSALVEYLKEIEE